MSSNEQNIYTELVKQDLVLNADSLGNVLDYAVQTEPAFGVLYGKRPEFDPWKAYRVVKNDPVVKGAIISIIDKFMMSGWHTCEKDYDDSKEDSGDTLEDVESKSPEDATKILKQLRFDRFLRRYVTQALIFKNAYAEVIKKSKEPVDLNVLETSFMKINTQINGDVRSYSQYVGNVSIGNLPEWKPEQIVHFKLDEVNTNAWADSDFMVLYETVLMKDYIRQFLLWTASTNQMRPVISVEAKLSATKAADFVSWLKATEKDLRKPIITEGKTTVQPLYDISKSGGSLLDIMNWCDNQILILLQVPPIAVGKADQSGRSNSVEQYTALDTRIRAIQVNLEELFTNDLLPKLGFSKVEFKFNTLDFKRMKELIDMAQVAKNAMFSEDAIRELMAKNGLEFETETLFDKPPEPVLGNSKVGTGNEGSIGNKDKDQMPSRKRQDNSTISKKNQKVMVRNTWETSLTPNRNWVL